MCIFCLRDVYILCYCRQKRPLSKVETRRNGSAHVALNCFPCIAYAFEYNAVKMT